MNNNIENRKRKIEKGLNFFEELLWLFDRSKVSELKDSIYMLRNELIHGYNQSLASNTSGSQNKNALVGILPNLFLDHALFKTNNDLVDFAENVLQISISRYEKRSRYEIIGLVVCAVPTLNESALSTLVDALILLTGDKQKLKKLRADKKKPNFSWNETIQNLSQGNV